MGPRSLVGALLAALIVGGCSPAEDVAPSGDEADQSGHGALSLMTPPALPPQPGALVDLRGFHEGRMRMPGPTSVRHEPDSGLLEINFVSDDDGQLFIRGRDLVAGEPVAVTIAFEVPLHVSPSNKLARRYQSSDDECMLTLESPFEVGAEVTGSFLCSHVSGERGSREDLAGSFRTGIALPESGREEARARGATT